MGAGGVTADATLDSKDAEIQRLRAALAEANGALKREIENGARSEKTHPANDFSASAAIDGIPGLVAILAPNGSVEVVNRQIKEYCGASLDELRNWGTNGIVHAIDLQRISVQFMDAISSGTPYDHELRLRRFDGAYRWFSNRGVPVRDASERILRWCVLLTDIDDRKRAEEALAANERNLRETVNAIPTLAWCNRLDGSNEFLNQRWHDYTGLSPEEANDWGWQVALHPDDLPGLLTQWTHMLATGEPGELEARLRRHDGVYRWFLFRCDPLRDETGSIIKWYGTNTDIEDLKQAEAELRRAYDSFADAQRLSRTGSFITDIVADEHNWSDEAYRIFDFEPATKVTTQRIRDIVHPEDLASFDSVIERGAAGIDVDFIFRVVTAGGTLKYVRGLAHVVEQVAGRPMFIGALQDVTESKLAESALQRNEAMLAQGEAVSETGSFLWKLDTGEIHWSNQLYRIFEFEPGTRLTPERVVERDHPLDRQNMQNNMARAQAGFDTEYDYEHRLLMPKGVVKYLHFVAKSTRDADGRLEYMGTVQDITSRRLAEQEHDRVRSELTHAARAMTLGVLAASLAHEVNQPLAGIITNANTCLRMLSADPPNVKGALETARRTIRDGNRASEVVSRLRTLFSKKELANETVDLTDAAREVLTLSAHELQRHHVAVLTEFARGAVEVVGDRVQIQQVILNLLLNASDAIKGIDHGARIITVRTENDGAGSARLSVRDTGVGVTEEILGKLFDPFFTTKPEGMGIGLSVSRSIIDRHKGHLWATPNDGPGATFAFSVPLAGVDPGAKPQ